MITINSEHISTLKKYFKNCIQHGAVLHHDSHENVPLGWTLTEYKMNFYNKWIRYVCCDNKQEKP